jgi:hypothetical protein
MASWNLKTPTMLGMLSKNLTAMNWMDNESASKCHMGDVAEEVDQEVDVTDTIGLIDTIGMMIGEEVEDIVLLAILIIE